MRLIDLIKSYKLQKNVIDVHYGDQYEYPAVDSYRVENLPIEEWDWIELTKNPNISYEDIINNPQFPWQMEYISANPTITMKFLRKHPELINTSVLSNPNFEYSIVKEYDLGSLKYSAPALLSNPGMNWDDIQKYAKEWNINLYNPENFAYLALNPNITPDIKNLRITDQNFQYFLPNPNFPIEFFLNYQNIFFPGKLSISPNVTPEFINSNPQMNWNWKQLSENPSITWDFVKANIHKPWDYKLLSKNPGIKFSDIINNPRRPWKWSQVSLNPNIAPQTVINNPQEQWYLPNLSKNTFGWNSKNQMRRDIALTTMGLRSMKLPPIILENIMNEVYNTRGLFGLYETMNIITGITERKEPSPPKSTWANLFK